MYNKIKTVQVARILCVGIDLYDNWLTVLRNLSRISWTIGVMTIQNGPIFLDPTGKRAMLETCCKKWELYKGINFYHCLTFLL